jgi:predicted nucleic acid-binding Zn ribbon protein/exonuclease VII small subunit
MTKNTACIVCGTSLKGRQTHFCSSTCKNRYHQSYDAQKRRGIARKLELVKVTGGRCAICGYDKNLAALTFHHTDLDKKDFKLDMRSMSNRSLETVLTELEKCILLCQNCHAELHYPHLDLAKLVPGAGRSDH